MEEYGVVTVGERGQIVIPKKIREKEKIKPHEKMFVVNIDKKVVIMPISPEPYKKALEALRAIGKAPKEE